MKSNIEVGGYFLSLIVVKTLRKPGGVDVHTVGSNIIVGITPAMRRRLAKIVADQGVVEPGAIVTDVDILRFLKQVIIDGVTRTLKSEVAA